MAAIPSERQQEELVVGDVSKALAKAMTETADRADARAERLKKDARELSRLADRLLEQANSLRVGAEALDPRMGVDDLNLAVGSHGKVELKDAIEGAKDLETFTRRTLAEHLGLRSPNAVSRFVNKMVERGIVKMTDAGFEYIPPQEAAGPTEHPTQERPEDRVARLVTDRGSAVPMTGKARERERRKGETSGQRRPGRRN